MRRIFLTFLVAILPLIVLSYKNCNFVEFLEFKYAHNKSYATAADEIRGCEIYTENVAMIDEHNKLFRANKESFKMGINMFADYTKEEFIQAFTGLAELPDESSQQPSVEPRRVKRSGTTTIAVPSTWRATSLDLTTSMIPVKSQGDCNSCWAFSSAGVFEYNLLKRYGSYYDLSEQNLVDCAHDTGCEEGEFVEAAFDYFLQNGVEYEYYNPYMETSGECTRDPYDQGNGLSSVYARQWRTIPSDEKLMAYILERKGWISVAINIEDLRFYVGGVVKASSCSIRPDHAVILVGYGYDSKSGRKFWKLKNSYGPNWGEAGYFRIERDANACGIIHEFEGYRVYLE